MVFSKLHFISFSFLLSLPFYSNSLALNGHKKELSVRMTKEPQQEFDEETASFVSQGICRAYITKDTSVINKGLSTCYNKCGQQARNDNAVHSVTCLSGGPSVDSYLDPDGNQFTDGRCECDIPILDQTVNDLVLSLPAIAEIGCELIFGALDAVLEAGVAAIPGVGEMTAGMEGAVQTAKTVLMNGKDANDFLQWFAKPCGSSNYTKMVDKIFDPLSGVPDSVLPGLGCKGNPCPGPPLKSPPPSSAPPSSTPSSSTPSSTSYPPGTTNGTAPSSAVSATTTIIAMSVSPTASSDPVCTAPDSTDGPSPTDPPPSRDDDKKKRTPPNTANCFVFNANQPQAPPSGQIPSFMTCRNKNGEANIYTSEYIAAVIQQGARYKLGNQLATSKRYPHEFENTLGVDTVTFEPACQGQKVLEFPILNNGHVIGGGRGDKTNPGTDRVLFALGSVTDPPTYCGVATHNNPQKILHPVNGRWMDPFGDCKYEDPLHGIFPGGQP